MSVLVGVLVGPKGRGSNMAALVHACQGAHPCRIAKVVSPNADSPALARATDLDVSASAVPYEPAETYGARLLAAFQECEWICLAGYLRLLPPEVLNAYEGRVLNIHPALLPKHGGKGMFGERVHAAVLESGDLESGCTVHFVNEQYDEGQILLQRRCPVLPGDTVTTLAARVLEQEHLAYAEALALAVRARS